MLCPNCKREMIFSDGIGHHIDFSGTADDYELEYYWKKYSCERCAISYDGESWDVPKDLLPSVKQKRTILFINNRLDKDLKAITRHQCWVDINRYFEKARR